MIKYKAVFWYEPRIEVVEVTKETDKSIFFMFHGFERRESKRSSDHKWFDDFASAKQFLVDKFQSKADWANQTLELAKSIHE